MKKTTAIFITVILALFLAGCSGTRPVQPEEPPVPPQIPSQPTRPPQEELEPGPPPQEIPPVTDLPPNEIGQVMILMYHQFGSEDSDWIRTPESFRKDLETLYDEGYRAVSLLDYVDGRISLPAGATPVIFTFDDSSPDQFRMVDGVEGPVPDPESAVGILESFAEEHPDFGLAATFYINSRPFGQRDYVTRKLEYLRDRGFEIGNHTMTHPRLSAMDSEQVAKELAGIQALVSNHLPGYEVESVALPFGLWPKDRTLLAFGEYDGISYRNRAVLMVGANPARSPYDSMFDPMKLPRVRGSIPEMEKWLGYFRRSPDKRYVSDGDDGTVTVPAGLADSVKEGYEVRVLQQ